MRIPSPAATMVLLHKRGEPAVLLPEFMREVFTGQRTGLLHATRGDGASVSFRAVNGEIVSGSSSAERGRLGETMVARGVISRDDLALALAIVKRERRRLAPVLRELGFVDVPVLHQELARHIRELLATALQWDQAALLFEDQELPEAPLEDLTLLCSMGELILEIVRRIPRAASVRRGLGDLDRPLVYAEHPPYGLDRIRLSAADGYVLARADGATTARQALAAAPLPAEAVERSLLGLLCTGVVHYASSRLERGSASL
jgi:hypothetical protein